MPIVETPIVVHIGSCPHAPASAELLVTTWAHLRPGMFHALEADIRVTVCLAVCGDRLA